MERPVWGSSEGARRNQPIPVISQPSDWPQWMPWLRKAFVSQACVLSPYHHSCSRCANRCLQVRFSLPCFPSPKAISVVPILRLYPSRKSESQGKGPDKIKLCRWFSWAPWVSPSKIEMWLFKLFPAHEQELVSDLDVWAMLLHIILQ